jgi:hypothetical protein
MPPAPSTHMRTLTHLLQGGAEADEDEGEGADDAEMAVPAGGYAARRAKRTKHAEEKRQRFDSQSGDALEDDFADGSEDDDGEEGK